jgi:nitroreductase
MTLEAIKEREKDVLSIIKNRRSPLIFSKLDVRKEQLQELFEAARWSASAFNEQPWRFIVASKTQNPSLHERIYSCLLDFNKEWAGTAPVLMITTAKKTFSLTGEENKHNWHDLGLAMGNLSIQATAMNLFVHQMGGVDRDKARQEFNIPDDYDIISAVAVGHIGALNNVDEDIKNRALKKRERNPLSKFVFDKAWESSSY